MKIYYDNVTGEVIWATAHNYYFTPNFDHDYETIIDLNRRVRESISLLILSDGQYAQDFREGRLIGVNVETKVPIFEYPNPENPEEPILPDIPLSVEVDALKRENKSQDTVIEELMFVIIPEIYGGGI